MEKEKRYSVGKYPGIKFSASSSLKIEKNIYTIN